MKTNRFLAVMATAASVAFAASCDKQLESDQGKPDKPDTEKPVEKSTECDLLTISLVAGDVKVEGFVYEEEKVAEVTCIPSQKELMTAAKAEITISEKAVISPDPEEIRDFTAPEGVTFTVTAEDGETSKAYKVLIRDAQIKTVCKKVWEKTYGDLGIKSTTSGIGNAAFSGDKIVTSNLEVIDLEGNKVGTLNTDGVVDNQASDFRFVCLANDHANHLVASAGYAAGGETFVQNKDNVAYTRIYIWSDGWDKAPSLLYEHKEANLVGYVSAGGDLPKKGILTIKAGASATQMHHCNVFTDGALTWNAFNTTLSGVDGNWGQIVSPCSGDVNGCFFVADSRGDNQGAYVVSRQGLKGNDVVLNGSLVDDGTLPGEHGGKNQYGNYSSTHARGFMLNGKPYAAITSSGWPNTYLTIQSADPEDEDHFLLRSQLWAAGQPQPCSAVYTVSSGEVYVLMSTAPTAPLMALYRISTEAI